MHKGGREAYFQAAYKILAASGAEALTIAGVCEQIPVTHGAFYHHFARTAEFVAAFADHWTEEWLARLDTVRTEPDAEAQLQALTRLALAMPISQERAIRSWASTCAVVRAAVDRADDAAVGLCAEALTEVLGDAARARFLAQTANALVVGLLMQVDPQEPQWFVDACAEFLRSSVGMELTVPGADGLPELRLVGA